MTVRVLIASLCHCLLQRLVGHDDVHGGSVVLGQQHCLALLGRVLVYLPLETHVIITQHVILLMLLLVLVKQRVIVHLYKARVHVLR